MTISQRLNLLVDHLIATVAAMIGGGVHPCRIEAPLTVLIHRRLRLIARRFAALAARHAAGRLPPPAPPATRAPRAAPDEPRTPRVAPRFPHRLRGTHAWLVRHAPPTAPYASQLQALLALPETRRLLAAAPQLRRLLRPLARMLGVTLPTPLSDPIPQTGYETETLAQQWLKLSEA